MFATLLRWCARLLSAVILVYVVVDAAASGFPDLSNLTTAEALLMASFFATWLGCAVLWKWELAGGLIVVGGMTAFYLVEIYFTGKMPRGPVIAAFFLPGLTAIASYALRRRVAVNEAKGLVT